MKSWIKFTIGLWIAISIAVLPCFSQTQNSKWEPAKSIPSEMKQVSKQTDIEVFTAPSSITISINQPSNIKIFTILGKLVSSQNLEPGIYEYHLATHGVYIIKTSLSTCKVAI